jgi:hypothetical protein
VVHVPYRADSQQYRAVRNLVVLVVGASLSRHQLRATSHVVIRLVSQSVLVRLEFALFTS